MFCLSVFHIVVTWLFFLGGFSQGGGLALLSALTLKQQLAGIVALSVALSQSIPQLPQVESTCHQQ